VNSQEFRAKVGIRERFPLEIVPHVTLDDLLKAFKFESKIILLGGQNLEKLRGYKAFVELDRGHGEIIITITGLFATSKEVFESLLPLGKEEISGE